jgi:hypothetical protein
VSRPTAGALTGAGFAQVGSSAKYTKTTGTALATVDIGNGGATSGSVQIAPASAGTPMTQADFQAHVAALNALGAGIANAVNEGYISSCQQYGFTL